MMKHKKSTKNQSGFTLIELVIVVVILGFLAATAIPKFLDLTDQAKQASIEGMAGGFATAISLVRSQWEAEGRPQAGGFNTVDYDGTELLLSTENATIRPGYVVASIGGLNTGDLLAGNTFSAANCVEIWNSILQQPPTITANLNALNSTHADFIAGVSYYALESGNNASSTCHYYLKETLTKNGTGYSNPGNTNAVGNSFTYQPANSLVVVHINNN
jgi:MSHA pilin protein MshB